jgi:hypothetical protein
MKPKYRQLTTSTAMAFMVLPMLAGIPATGQTLAAPTQTPNNFADPAFQSTWTRTDQLVDEGSVKRSYFWGPLPGFTAYEDYAEGANGKHLVQYFDKSRMEINNPNGDKTNPFYVTNGLLTMELISGQMQTGNNQYVQRYPAEIDLASDGDDLSAGTPTYASFRYVSNIGYTPTGRNRLGETVNDTINRAGLVGTDSTYNNYNVKDAFYEAATQHNIPDIFWSFLNQNGPIMQDGKTVDARLSDPYFYATGYPIAEAYWARVKIAGKADTAVLIQPYERRVLTYVPDAPQGFKVQMGNIRQHYYAWRYSDAGKPPTPQVACQKVPVRGFGKIWADHPEVQAWLGCSYQDEMGVSTVQQSFQHGQMLTMLDFYGYYGSGGRTIYVLFDDSTMQSFSDNYQEGDPEPDIKAPAGLYTPTRGFGKVWREGTGARVRERLGWATAPAVVALAPTPQGPYPVPYPVPTNTPVGPSPTPVPPGMGGAVQFFSQGMMVYTGPMLKKIYVLYSGSGYGTGQVDRWIVYDDTYTGK